MNKHNVFKVLAAVGVAGVAGGASAAGIDFSTMTGSVDTTTVVAALVAMGVVKMAPGFAKWAVNKVGSFFS